MSSMLNPKPMTLTDASGSKRRVRIFALITSNKPLEWLNPYSESKVPEMFIPQKTEHGSVVYEVPLPYATRLLAAEPYKYFLAYPESVSIKIAGGMKTLHAQVEKVDLEGKVVRSENGLPLLCDPQELEDMRERAAAAALKEKNQKGK